MKKLEVNDLKSKLCELVETGWFTEVQSNAFIEHFKNKTNGVLEFTSPNEKDVFNAFKIGENDSIIKPEDVRVLIIGQDPYPNPQKAQGLAFSHKNWDSIDASLLNIYKAIKAYKDDCKFDEVDNNKIKGDKDSEPWETNLKEWARTNRVLLLNTALTYNNLYPDKKGKKLTKSEKSKQEKCQKEHADIWKPFIKNTIIKLITSNSEKLAVFLWGKDAQNLFFECTNSFSINDNINNLANESITYNVRKTRTIEKKLLCFTTSHPSPRGFWRGFKYDAPNHFKACDEFLGTDTWKKFPENNKFQIF